MQRSQEAVPQSTMVEITPTVGVIRHKAPEHQFGLERMFHTAIEDNSLPEYRLVDGTLLRYQPGDVGIRVTRQDLEAEEINHVGELARNMNNQGEIKVALDAIVNSTERLVVKLRTLGLAAPTEEMVTTELSDPKSKVLIENETGISLDQLKQRQTEVGKKLKAMHEEAKLLGVSAITVGFGAIMTNRPEPPEK